jgi:hypothetical protein
MGVHESQSRIYENQLGRSRAFTGWMFGQMRVRFGDFGVEDADAFHAAVNRVLYTGEGFRVVGWDDRRHFDGADADSGAAEEIAA